MTWGAIWDGESWDRRCATGAGGLGKVGTGDKWEVGWDRW